MAITKATASSIAPAAKGNLVVGSATNDAAVLGVGANDTVLTADSAEATGLKWATPSSGSMTLISTTNMTSGGGGFTLTSIPSTYKDLRIIIENYLPSAASSNWLDIRFNQDSGANRHKGVNSFTSAGEIVPNATYIQMFGDSNNGTATFSNIQVTIPSYTNTTTAKFFLATGLTNNETTNTQFNITYKMGFYNQTTAISSFLFFPESGSITSGTMYLYGVK